MVEGEGIVCFSVLMVYKSLIAWQSDDVKIKQEFR